MQCLPKQLLMFKQRPFCPFCHALLQAQTISAFTKNKNEQMLSKTVHCIKFMQMCQKGQFHRRWGCSFCISHVGTRTRGLLAKRRGRFATRGGLRRSAGRVPYGSPKRTVPPKVGLSFLHFPRRGSKGAGVNDLPVARRVKQTCRWHVCSQSGERSMIATWSPQSRAPARPP